MLYTRWWQLLPRVAEHHKHIMFGWCYILLFLVFLQVEAQRILPRIQQFEGTAMIATEEASIFSSSKMKHQSGNST
ncbi:hypothetical protein HAX54_018274 [Datura stramonium]|uniref:Uncharacterized protein n=1 Tax=Datura stramonium TaxID=4076 RepID=A0ABS8S1Y1_DATST|nr:hypothetical protein [Datura stramonium]